MSEDPLNLNGIHAVREGRELSHLKVNGKRSVSSSNSSDVKYPPTVISSSHNRGVSMDIDAERLYEAKPNTKLVRIFTVILYMFSVSLGAILLSFYYVFLWQNPHTSAIFAEDDNHTLSLNGNHSGCNHDVIGDPMHVHPDQDYALAVEDQSYIYNIGQLQLPVEKTRLGKSTRLADNRGPVPVTAFPKNGRGIPPVIPRGARDQVGGGGVGDRRQMTSDALRPHSGHDYQRRKRDLLLSPHGTGRSRKERKKLMRSALQQLAQQHLKKR